MMRSDLVRWFISAVFGLLAGWFSGSAIFVLLAWVESTAIMSWLPWIALAMQGVVTLVVTLLLARLADTRRRLGWGCLTLSGSLVVNGIGLLLFTNILGALFGFGPGQESGEARGPALFVLMLGLPFAVLCIILAIVGAILLRKRSSQSLSAAASR